MNVVVLIGRMVADPELKYTPNGVAVTSFRIAIDRRFKNAAGEKQSDFIDIVAWRQSAEFAANYLSKGRLVAVQGELHSRSWVQPDGQKRYKTEVVADNIQGLDRPKDGQGQAPAAAATGDGAEHIPSEPPPAGAESDMDYDPFAEE
ncbi:MAG: single-stranded DNA-binding protein [Armatimonadetes bacterium]|nr:single-stranded DNA-binding protein [Armatimonadota bacterium]